MNEFLKEGRTLLDPDQLFLFDFDGLLVDTELIHYQAYNNMLRGRGYDFRTSFSEYCAIAHYSDVGLRGAIAGMFPDLQKYPWVDLYHEKTEEYLKLVRQGKVTLMPGVADLLESLDAAESTMCVVTHSKKELVDTIRNYLKPLAAIQYWITREDYLRAKPAPDGYLKAIKDYAKPGQSIIGFEDTPRGIRALMDTPAKPVLVTTLDYPEIPSLIERGVTHLKNFVFS